MIESGGERARGGFRYQDLATAYYFLKIEEADVIKIEKFEDFSIELSTSEQPQRHIFQAKTSKHGGMGWIIFKDILSNFYKISSELERFDEQIIFHIVANYKPNKKVNSFVEDLEKLHRKKMQIPAFRNRWDERRLENIRESIEGSLNDDLEFDNDIFNDILSGIRYNFHSESELESGIKNYLNDCSPGRVTSAFETIMEEISSTKSGAISKRQLEKQIGFSLEVVESSSSSVSGTQLFKGDNSETDVATIDNKYRGMNVDISEPRKDKMAVDKKLNDYRPKNDEEEAKVQTAESTIKQGLNKAEDGLRQYQSGVNDVESGFDMLLTLDPRGDGS